LAQDRLQVRVVEMVEELPHIDLQDPAACHAHGVFPHRLHRIVSGALWTEAIREIVE
jgi:hypothetical protein